MSNWHCWEELMASAVFALFKPTQWSSTQMLQTKHVVKPNSTTASSENVKVQDTLLGDSVNIGCKPGYFLAFFLRLLSPPILAVP